MIRGSDLLLCGAPLGFEPRTCGLRDDGWGGHRVPRSALTCGYVLHRVHQVPLDPGSETQIVGRIVGRRARRRGKVS